MQKLQKKCEIYFKNEELNEIQKENLRHSLFECKHSKLKYNQTDIIITNLEQRPYKFEISDDESEDQNKSTNLTSSNEEDLDGSSQNSLTTDHLNNEFKSALSISKSQEKSKSLNIELKDLSSEEIDKLIKLENPVNYDFRNLNDNEKKLIDSEQKKRLKKFELARVKQPVQISPKNSLASKIQILQDQQKILKETFHITTQDKKKNAQLEEELRKKEEDRLEQEKLQAVESDLKDLVKELNSMKQKCTEKKDVFNKSFIENIQSIIKDIDQELKSETKNSSDLLQLEEKCSILSKETSEKIDTKISDHLKAKAKKEKEEKDKRNQEKYLQEIQKYITKYIEVKKFLEHLTKDKLESKRNVLKILDNKQLNEQIDEFELNVKSHLNDVDSYVNKIFEKNLSIVVADQKEAELDKIFASLNENLARFIKIGHDYENKQAKLVSEIENLEKSKEKENLKLAEEKKRAEQAKQETNRLEQEKRQQEEALRIANIKKQEEETAAAAAKKASEVNEKIETVKNVNENDKNGINAFTLTEFESIRIFYDKIRNEVETVLSEKSLKMYKFELQKAINFPLNSLLDDKTNEDNVRNFDEKIRTFIRLFNGQTCAITSTLVVNPTRHPSAIDFCLVYLAKQLVEKAAETVSSRPETSFQYAQLIKNVFKEKSQFETILMGQLQEKCPFVVPFYKPRLQNQNENEYFESLGYKIMNGKIEDEILYYKRMNGILHLYFTLLMNTSNIKNSYQQTANHFSNGYKKAWQWFSDVLNMTPRPDITAEMLAIFFKCCGFQMQRIYGKQFLKLTNVCLNDFFPLIKSIPAGKQSGASIGRLQTVFDEFKINNQFSEWKN